MSETRKFYFFSLIIIYILYFLTFLGIFSKLPGQVFLFHGTIQILLCILLLYRFHPFRRYYKFTKNDAKLIFSAALLLLINLISLPLTFTNESKKEIKNILKPIYKQ